MHDGIWDINWIEDWELHDSCLQVLEGCSVEEDRLKGTKGRRYLAQNKEVITFLEVTGLCVWWGRDVEEFLNYKIIHAYSKTYRWNIWRKEGVFLSVDLLLTGADCKWFCMYHSRKHFQKQCFYKKIESVLLCNFYFYLIVYLGVCLYLLHTF